MPDDTCFKFSKVEAAWDDVRQYLRSFGTLIQVFIPKDTPNIVYVKYKHANSASKAWTALEKDPRATMLEKLNDWPFEKKKSMSSTQNTSSDTGSQDYSEANFLPPPMVCSKCRRTNAELVCGVCSAWYCNEQCQLLDWPNHKANCIPRLVRGFPVLNSLQNLAFRNQQQQMAQQMAQQQMQQMQQQQLNQFLSQWNDQQPKEKETGKNWEKHRQPGRPEEQMLSNEVQQKPKETPKPIAEPPNYVLNANETVTPAAQQTKQRLLSEKSPAKEQPRSKEAAPSRELPSNREGKNLQKPSSQQVLPSNATLNGPKKAAAQQPVAAPKVPEDAPNAPQEPSLLIRMRNLAQATSKRTIANNAFPKVGSTVAISFVAEGTLFIHEASDVLNDPFMGFVNRSIEHASEIKQSLQQPPVVGDIVFAPFDGLHYRAIVQKIDGEIIVVKFPDFGNTQQVRWKASKEVKDTAIKYAPCLTHEVSLAGEVPFSPAVHAMLSGLVEEQTFEIMQIEAANPSFGVRKVELRNVETKQLLSKEIREVAANEAQAKQPPATLAAKVPKLEFPDPATYKPVFMHEFKDLSFPQDTSKPIELTIVEAADFECNQLVSVIMIANQRAFAKILKECEEYGQLDRNEYPGESAPHYGCLVKYEETWCRAVKGVDDFYLVDLGVICTPKKIDAVRRFPPALSREMYCAECVVENPDFFLELMKDGIDCADAFRGLSVKAKVSTDKQTSVIHLEILSVIT